MDWPLPIRILLLPFSWIYGLAVRVKTWLYTSGRTKQKRLNGAVISVGNLTVGGTGKTPMVMWLAEKFLAEGKRVAILSRGYRGERGTSDEIELLKRRVGGKVRFGVGADRFAEGKRLEEAEPVDVFLLDDGFQHLKLARDVDIVLMDSTRPSRKEWLLPAGRLREPLSSVSRASLIIFTRVQQAPFVPPAIKKFPKFPVFPAATKLLGFRRIDNKQGAALSGADSPPQPVFAFCGIGNPNAFFEDLDRWGIRTAGREVFRDHHVYSANELRRLENAAQRAGAKALLTTEKDIQNLGDTGTDSVPIYCCEIGFEIPDEGEVWELITGLIQPGVGVKA